MRWSHAALTVLVVGACGRAAQPESEPAPRVAPPPPAAPTVAAPSRDEPPLSDAGAADGAAPDAEADAGAPRARAPIPPDMLPIPGGTFVMGADTGGEEDEHPAHQVTVRGFLLDRTEVTNAAYLEGVKAGACRMYRTDAAVSFHAGPDRDFRHPEQPVSAVSWDDAKGYCEWRGRRLPTEAEWERAARGDDGRRYPWGDEPPDPKRHGCWGSSPPPCGGRTAPVGSYPAGAGPYGHLDLAGNVWEWTADYYDPMAYTRPTAKDGVPGSCEEILESLAGLRKNHRQGFTGTNPIPVECERVLRGGAYNYRGEGLRAMNRVHHPGSFRILVAGFRCARDAPE
ncbi:MAG: formylglycine-generating enzyme family protein [Sorangiineae bacterium]|nr:formylglycine-generating enzyme family protein [Polyangiaceae bacterium]MEB2324528.1 formylglycine-generating enzyme family protein [Sorangiineae bacterium]